MPNPITTVSFVVLWLGGLLFLNYGSEQSAFPSLLAAFASSFLGYWWFTQRQWTEKGLQRLCILGVAGALFLVFDLPRLSDDVFRFLWDGNLLVAGENPFGKLPRTWAAADFPTPHNTEALFERLNSPDYYTVYPPLPQGINYLVTLSGNGDIVLSILGFKVFAFLAFAVSVLLLYRLAVLYDQPQKNVLFWALNPLVIVETVSNLHHEIWMAVGVGIVLLALKTQRGWLLGIGGAIATLGKLLPFLFAPYLLLKVPPALRWKATVVFLLLTFLGWYVFIDQQLVENFGESLDLYFRKFEFNASLYYFFNAIGTAYQGYNTIGTVGPLMAILAGLSILGISFVAWRRKWAVPETLLALISIYLFFGTTIHPWYVLLPVFLCCLTRFRFPLFWSALIVLTYVNYWYTPYWENPWIVAVEYLVLFSIVMVEIRNKSGTLFA